jgi:allantoinase
VSGRFSLRSRRIVTPGGLLDGYVTVEDGRIVEAAGGPAPAGAKDVGGLVVMPGLVDPHVHVNEPGRAEWEGFETATSAAAWGGVTTIVDMPLNSIPPTTTREALAAKLAAAEGRLRVDAAFWGGVVPGNAAELEPMLDAGVRGFKCFLLPSGVDEFPHVTEKDLRAALPILAKRNAPLLVHAELEQPISASTGSARLYESFLASRPRSWENTAIELMIRLAREFHARVHIVHLSSSDALEPLAEARRRGVAITAETCPHYLTFCSEEIGDGRTDLKCCPPIREAGNREKLWKALFDGILDFVASDHSPCTPELKARGGGDFLQAWGGISSVQFLLPAVWTEARKRGAPLEELAEWLSRRPAVFAGLAPRKGAIAPGADADLVVWDPDASFVVEEAAIRHRHKKTPYLGRKLDGVIHSTYLRGRLVMESGRLEGSPAGRPLVREASPV